MRTFLWNLRFNLAWLILPSQHKHVSVVPSEDVCWVCEREA